MIDYKYCISREFNQLNKLREEFDRRALTNDELKNQLSSDLHQISSALHDGGKPIVVTEVEKAQTPSLSSKFEIEEDDDDEDDDDEIIIKKDVVEDVEKVDEVNVIEEKKEDVVDDVEKEEEDDDDSEEEMTIFKKN